LIVDGDVGEKDTSCGWESIVWTV